jgi:nucleotide-binding universal stress UspA family protein
MQTHRYSHIMLAVAPGQEVQERFDAALRFAERGAAAVTLFTVVEELPEWPRSQLGGQPSRLDLRRAAIKQQQDRLERMRKTLAREHPRMMVRAETAMGIPFIEIIRASHRLRCDLVVVDAHRGDKRRLTALGATTRHLMRKSPVPIWAMDRRRVGAGPIHRVAAAVDVAAPTSDGMALNEAIVRSARDLCHAHGAQLEVCHAWRLEGEDFLRSWGRLGDSEIALAAHEEFYQRRAAVFRLLDRCGVPPEHCSVSLVCGRAQDALPELLDSHGVQMLVMGTVCRTDVAGFIMGNTAESLLDAVTCSVFTLKPRRFRTPVELYHPQQRATA